MFIAALFTITKARKQLKCPTTKEWIKMWYIHTMEDQSAIKKEWNNAIWGDMDGPTGSLRWFRGKESTCQCRRCRFHPWVRKIPWRKKWQPPQGSCLENLMDREAWWATVCGVPKNQKKLSNWPLTQGRTQRLSYWEVRQRKRNII